MKSKRYFDSHRFLSSFIVLLTLLKAMSVTAQEQPLSQDSILRMMDSIDVSLITCAPGDEIYALYGHTAIRIHDKNRHTDFAFNYGLFDFRKSLFALRFAFGKTDYELGPIRYSFFMDEYIKRHRTVWEQKINLTRLEKLSFIQEIYVNAMPENRVYRYNYFYSNCTTKARDIIRRNIQGTLFWKKEDSTPHTYRELIHQYTLVHPWAQLLDDLCLGFKADRPISAEAQEFLPFKLKDHFDKAYVRNADGTERQLVSSSEMVVRGQDQPTINCFVTPDMIIVLILLLSGVLLLVELKKHNLFISFDVLIMTLYGIAGILLFVLFLSEHPTTSTNLNILVLNPLYLFFIPKGLKENKQRHVTKHFLLPTVCTIVFLLAMLTRLQTFPLFTIGLALILMSRLVIRYVFVRNGEYTYIK